MNKKSEFIRKNLRSGDLKRCSEVFGVNYSFVRHVGAGTYNNERVTNLIVQTIKARERMEQELRSFNNG